MAALVDDRFEEVELTEPKAAMENAGARVAIISRHPRMTAMRHHEVADRFEADVALSEARAENYDALFLPGGVANGDSLRIVPEAQAFARALVAQAKPVAVICHGGWLLISAGLVRNRTITSWPTLQDDYRNAGAHWVDREVVVDGNWVSSRKPDDIPAFSSAVIEVLAREPRRQAA
ncbi:MAG: type 1 glutamine amidotransferase domain-containing protein [Terriglobales bacterium]